MNIFFSQNFGAKFIVNFPQFIHTAKWKFDYIICREKKKMKRRVDNRFAPNYVPNNMPWYERDGLMSWYNQVKCQEFLESTGSNFQNLEKVILI